MDIDLFSGPGGDVPESTLDAVLRAYPAMFRLRRHDRGETALHRQLWLASFPLDETTGHGSAPVDEPPAPPEDDSGRSITAAAPASGYGFAYEYDYEYSGDPVAHDASTNGAALALFNRMALIDGAGPLLELRPGVWRCPFSERETFRAAFQLALRHALAEAREAAEHLRRRRPDLSDTQTAELLDLTLTALYHARNGCPRTQ